MSIRCVGSIEMRYVPGFGFLVSVSVLGVDSVIMGWTEVVSSAVSGSVADVGMGWVKDIDLIVI